MNRQIPFAGRLGVNIKLYPPCKRKRDVDNFLKAVLDLMTKAGVWQDDSQVDILTVSRESKCKGGKVIIEIWQRPKKPLSLGKA
jgi:crossover junction endodeoxyribonuclease RusA